MSSLIQNLRNRELGNQSEFEDYIYYKEYLKYICKEDHIYGYSPHIRYGRCRCCFGNKPLTFTEFKTMNDKEKYITGGIKMFGKIHSTLCSACFAMF